MSKPAQPAAPSAAAKQRRNSNMTPERKAIEAALARMKPDETITAQALARQLAIDPTTASVRLRQMAHEGLTGVKRTGNQGGQWKLTELGRQRLLGIEAVRAEQAQRAKDKAQQPPTAVAGPRTWRPPVAKRGELSPWHGGNPLRDGAQTAYGLPSRGIRA